MALEKNFKRVYREDSWKRADHEAVRKTVGWYFYTHQILEVTGEDATVFLEYMYPKNIGNLALGRARYTPMLNDEAIVRDDVVVFRLEENRYWISTLYAIRTIPWFEKHKGNYKVNIEELTRQWIMYAVQGPRSKDMVNDLVAENIDDQKFFEIRDNKIDDIDVKINRGGFTGEAWGYEVYTKKENRAAIEEKLAASAEKFEGRRVTEFQVMVLTLPTEKGYMLMADLEQCTPYSVPGFFSKGINFDKEFVGKEALIKVRDEGPDHELLGFILEDDDANICSRDKTGEGAEVCLPDGEHIGYVSRFTYSYNLEKSIGFIWVETGKVVKGSTVIINDIEPYKAEVTDVVFF